MEELSRRERRRLEREKSREERERERGRQRRARASRKAMGYGISLLVIAGIVFGVYRWATQATPGRAVPILGHQHISERAQGDIAYNSTPPTSGPHYASRAPWGIHRRPIPKPLQVHNLEDGGVLVQYRCRDCPDLIEKIEAIVNRYRDHVIAAPYPDMKPLIALTAWGRIDELEAFDEKRIVAFIEAYQGIDHHPRR